MFFAGISLITSMRGLNYGLNQGNTRDCKAVGIIRSIQFRRPIFFTLNILFWLKYASISQPYTKVPAFIATPLRVLKPTQFRFEIVM